MADGGGEPQAMAEAEAEARNGGEQELPAAVAVAPDPPVPQELLDRRKRIREIQSDGNMSAQEKAQAMHTLFNPPRQPPPRLVGVGPASLSRASLFHACRSSRPFGATAPFSGPTRAPAALLKSSRARTTGASVRSCPSAADVSTPGEPRALPCVRPPPTPVRVPPPPRARALAHAARPLPYCL